MVKVTPPLNITTVDADGAPRIFDRAVGGIEAGRFNDASRSTASRTSMR